VGGAENCRRPPPLRLSPFTFHKQRHCSAAFSSAEVAAWRDGFYARLAAHAAAAATRAGCACGGCGEPSIIAFAGKRQLTELWAAGGGDGGGGRGGSRSGGRGRGRGGAKPPKLEYGPQPPGVRPPGWPLGRSELWVLPSTSGAAPMTNEAREAPFRSLAARMALLPWPRTDAPRCRSAVASGAGLDMSGGELGG
jgi:TDG/mug DNA glycosylase family protein